MLFQDNVIHIQDILGIEFTDNLVQVFGLFRGNGNRLRFRRVG